MQAQPDFTQDTRMSRVILLISLGEGQQTWAQNEAPDKKQESSEAYIQGNENSGSFMYWKPTSFLLQGNGLTMIFKTKGHVGGEVLFLLIVPSFHVKQNREDLKVPCHTQHIMVKESVQIYCLNEIQSNSYEHACLISNVLQCCVLGSVKRGQILSSQVLEHPFSTFY